MSLVNALFIAILSPVFLVFRSIPLFVKSLFGSDQKHY